MKKQLLIFLLTLLMSMVGNEVLAYDAKIDGIYYNFSGSEASVTYYSRGSSDNSNAYKGNIVIPSYVTYDGHTYSVTNIDEKAFSGCDNLTSIAIPNSVISIGKHAFQRCQSLTSITIPNSVTSIGDEAFSLSGLTSVDIPNSVKAIGESAFSNCHNLASLTLGNSVKSIGSNAFAHCKPLASITIPNSVTSVSATSFHNTAWYNSQPDGMVYLGKVAYKYKGKMPANTSITIKEGTSVIANAAFSSCSGLTSITIPNSVTTIGIQAFAYCSGLASITIPNSVTYIGYDAFKETAWYDNQHDGLVYAGKVAYKYKGWMYSNTHIKIKEGTLAIAKDAFYDARGLISVTIPNSVLSIDNGAFWGCI